MSDTPKKRRLLLPLLLGAIVLCALCAVFNVFFDPRPISQTAEQASRSAPAATVTVAPTAKPVAAAKPTATPAASAAQAGLSAAAEPPAAEPPEAEPTATPQPTSAPTLEQLILAIVGDSNRQGAPAPVIEINDEQVVVTFPADDNLTINLMRSAMQRKILAIGRTVRDSTGNANDLRVEATGQLTDAYGNTSEEPIMRVNLSRATLEKINFDGIQPDNLPIIADIYWQHPALDQ